VYVHLLWWSLPPPLPLSIHYTTKRGVGAEKTVWLIRRIKSAVSVAEWIMEVIIWDGSNTWYWFTTSHTVSVVLELFRLTTPTHKPTKNRGLYVCLNSIIEYSYLTCQKRFDWMIEMKCKPSWRWWARLNNESVSTASYPAKNKQKTVWNLQNKQSTKIFNIPLEAKVRGMVSKALANASNTSWYLSIPVMWLWNKYFLYLSSFSKRKRFCYECYDYSLLITLNILCCPKKMCNVSIERSSTSFEWIVVMSFW
jgi:hypothetical protein